jgi:hypothetical protein
MPSRLGLRPALLRLAVVATMISVGVIFSMLGVVSPAASARGSGRISARLTTTAFTVVQAGKVNLSYKFSSKSARFAYVLSGKQGANWLQVRSTSKRGSFRGSQTMTVKQLFGPKPMKVGPYRVKLSAEANSVTLRFTLIRSSFAPVRPPPAVSSNVVVVTTPADSVNGDVSSVAALNASPGKDGISLREALMAADATGGSATVSIMFSAALNGATIEPATPLPPIHRDHFVLEGIAPNGSPATVTLDGRLVTAAENNQAIVWVRASDVTVRWLRFTGVTPYSDPASQEFAVRVAPGPFVYLNDTPHGPQQIANVQILDNVFDNSEVPRRPGLPAPTG